MPDSLPASSTEHSREEERPAPWRDEVLNQSAPPLRHAFVDDLPLREALRCHASGLSADLLTRLADLGAQVGTLETRAMGFAVNAHPPVLHTHDPQGRRRDDVEYHPDYHRLMRIALEGGWHSVAWEAEGCGGHQAHVAALYLLTQAEPGFCCPITMTHAAWPALRQDESLAAFWGPRLRARSHDPRTCAPRDKHCATFGMAMTERQGGSDVRSNLTQAHAEGEGYRLNGHKWFMSAPMSDAFLTLAQLEEGLTCFVVPRRREDGSHNGLQLQRLKDKCGNRANASSEVRLVDARGQRLGEPGRGITTILEMVHQTRLDAATAPVALMRQALVEALHHCQQRHAFGKPLASQPLMQQVLADIALEVEAGIALCLRIARQFDDATREPDTRPLARLAPAIAKYWHNRRAPALLAEAMECLGGNGYIEEHLTARLYREAPVNAIWEGSGNVLCLDVLRTLARHPDAGEALLSELRDARGQSPRYDAALAIFERGNLLHHAEEARARQLVQSLAVLWQAALLIHHAPADVAEAFCATRLAGTDMPGATGVHGLPPGMSPRHLLARVLP
ncbi:acyl-CoA dehydrogenase family protein [Cobetia sp. 14N.309.X.WAT.E.A4]|uniref:acyl-CoA dehydrogenase family protein n=1 Tax=Cobetia sp. 14N.309.X.WAT.E.A4 TaxID=2998323 RepID=UPI0025B13FCD|nr:acyl-CoA dehydrogenase family protein [Cobetia sp. 14N.309.X.WAT.E.A4]MDN2657527.1 acyl-CoA dehydrogenase family protein [Cobetia sp. 14N.309.X.WAT.E.A4]